MNWKREIDMLAANINHPDKFLEKLIPDMRFQSKGHILVFLYFVYRLTRHHPKYTLNILTVLFRFGYKAIINPMNRYN